LRKRWIMQKQFVVVLAADFDLGVHPG
jgi:hypothetical protein